MCSSGEVRATPSARAFTTACTARTSSRPAASRCSTTSGCTLPVAVRKSETGQNPTSQTGTTAPASPAAADPAASSFGVSVGRSAMRDPSSVLGAVGHAPDAVRAAPPAGFAERDLQPVVHELRPLDVEALERLGEHDVALVRPHADVELVGLAVDVEVILLREGQAKREQVDRPSLVHLDGLVTVEDVRDGQAPVDLLAHLGEEVHPHHLAVEE